MSATFKITPDTVLTQQEKDAFHAHMVKGKSAGFVARFNEVFFDIRTFALVNPATGEKIKGNGDLLSILSGKGTFGFTEEVNQTIDNLGLDVSQLFKRETALTPGAPSKSLKRFVQFALEVAKERPNYKNIDRTLAICMFALREANGLPLSATSIKALGSKDNRKFVTGAITRGVSRESIRNRIGLVYEGTIETQVSRSIGVNGFAKHLGAVNVFGKGKNATFTINAENVMSKIFFALLDNATESELNDLFVGEEKED